LLIVSPDSQAPACPLSGRNSTYRAVRNCGATSNLLRYLLFGIKNDCTPKKVCACDVIS
jgi:hypothetical protein